MREHFLRVAPKALKVIELSGLVGKYVDNDAAEVHQHPYVGTQPLRGVSAAPRLRRSCLSTSSTKRLYVRGRGAVADNEVVGKHGLLSGLEHL